ncbi:hypothetical protein J1N35_001286 [Gossypium stocksii]|uniref:Uncharacterized protein n=1 Tax=Gossypium stocksii TaxID=47602 RepID=A0A9D3WJN6_9ROSI|nr:hypothetical protein J1N35_001286 [Gossypium stocksii]
MPWVKQELQRQGVQELTKAMTVVKFLIELVSKKDKFESSKANGKGDGGEDEEGHGKYDNGNSLQTVRNCLKGYVLSVIKVDDEPEKMPISLGSAVCGVKAKRGKERENAKLDESKASKLESMILTLAKRNSRQVGSMFMDINIVGQRKSALVDTRELDLFILEKVIGKLGFSVRKSNKKIKTMNSKEVLTMRVAREIKLQLDEWKGKVLGNVSIL